MTRQRLARLAVNLFQWTILLALLGVLLRLDWETLRSPAHWITKGELLVLTGLCLAALGTFAPARSARVIQAWCVSVSIVTALTLGAALTAPGQGVLLFGLEDKALLVRVLALVALGMVALLSWRVQRFPLRVLMGLFALYVSGSLMLEARLGITLAEAFAGSGWLAKLPLYLQPAFLAMLLLGLGILLLLARLAQELRRHTLSASTLGGALCSGLVLLACLTLFQPGTGRWVELGALKPTPGRGNVLGMSSGCFVTQASSQGSSYDAGAFRLVDGRVESYETQDCWTSENGAAFPHEVRFALRQDATVDQAIFYNLQGESAARQVEVLGAGPDYPPDWQPLGQAELKNVPGPQVVPLKQRKVRQLLLRITSNWGDKDRTSLAELEVSGPEARALALSPVSTNLLDRERGARLVRMADGDLKGAENLLAGPEGGVWQPGAEGEVVLALPGPEEHLVQGVLVSFPPDSKARELQLFAARESPREEFESLGRWVRPEGSLQRLCLFPPTPLRYLKLRVRGGDNSSVLRVQAFQPPLRAGKLPPGARTGGLLGSYYKGLRFADHSEDRVEAVDLPQALPDPETAVIWRGFLNVKETGLMRLGVAADDGFRLLVNGEPVLTRWSDQKADQVVEVPLVLARGWVPVELWLVNRKETGGARLLWAPGSSSAGAGAGQEGGSGSAAQSGGAGSGSGGPASDLRPIPAEALAAPDAPPRRTPRMAAQDGVDWLAPAAVAWQEEHRCMGCHVQGQALMGLSLAAKNEYRVDPADPSRLASFLAGDVRGEDRFSFSHGDLVSAVQYVAMALAQDQRNLEVPLSENQLRLARWLGKQQQPDGSFHNDRSEPPIEQGDMMVTANTLLALRALGPLADKDRLSGRADHAAEWLRQARAETTQDRCHRILGLAREPGDAPRQAVQDEVAALWGLQQKDGGWGERPGLDSNGFATGQVLYAMKVAGVSVSDARFQRGVGFLMDSQQVFGSWPAVHTDAGRPSEYAPTMWAVIGLAGSFESIVLDIVQPTEGQAFAPASPEQKVTAQVLNFTQDEVSSVAFFLDGKPLGEDELAPYEASFKPGELAAGPHELSARARASSGKTYEAKRGIVMTAGDLKARLVQPSEGALVVTPMQLEAEVDNQTGEALQSVLYRLDGQDLGQGKGKSYGLNWDPAGVTPGRHTLTLVARTASGKEATDTRTFEVQRALEVTLVAPPQGWGSIPLVTRLENRTRSPVKSVRFEAQDKLIADSIEPGVNWDASGLPPGPVEVKVKVTLENGLSAEARATVILQKPVEVTFYATVTDPAGHHQTDLAAADFRVEEDGKAQSDLKVAVTTDKIPVNMAVVIDHSGSMRGSMEGAIEAAKNFVDLLRPSDRACLIPFSDRPQKTLDFTADRAALKRAIGNLVPRGGTALYDSLDLACDLLSTRTGRRAVILLTDGKDENDPGTAPGSVHTLEQALQGARKADCIVYAMGLGKGVDRKVLTTMAERTGGRAYFPPTVKDLKDTYAAVATELRSQYEIRWTSSNPARDGAWRKVSVSVNRPGLKVVTQEGYQAPDH